MSLSLNGVTAIEQNASSNGTHYVQYTDASRRVRVFSVRLSVCLSVFPRDISQTAAARITKLDIEMFHHKF